MCRALKSLKVDMEEKDILSIFSALSRLIPKSDVEVLDIDRFVESIITLQADKVAKSSQENLQVSELLLDTERL